MITPAPSPRLAALSSTSDRRVSVSVPVRGEQRDCRGLPEAVPCGPVPQRAQLRIPTAQPEERQPAEALRRPQVRSEEGGGGGVRPLDPRPEAQAGDLVVGDAGADASSGRKGQMLRCVKRREWETSHDGVCDLLITFCHRRIQLLWLPLFFCFFIA